MLAAVPAFHVAIFEANDSIGFSSHVGEFHATCLKAQGAVGTITEGGCRDVEAVLELDYPVFCRYSTPQDSLARWEIVDWGEPITIGPVGIQTGDYIVADSDGVVVVPAAVREEVLKRSESKAARESTVRDEIQKGDQPLEALRRAG
jgi:regulator of RNase E activity RraA